MPGPGSHLAHVLVTIIFNFVEAEAVLTSKDLLL